LEPATACRAHCQMLVCGSQHLDFFCFVFDIMAGVAGMAGMAGMAGEGRGEGVVDSLSTVSVRAEPPKQPRSLHYHIQSHSCPLRARD
jgi:hypothetical protein